MSSKKLTTCKICNEQFISIGVHVYKKHSITRKDYYDTFFKKDNEAKCLVCNKPTKWVSPKYQKFCSTNCSNNHKETTALRSTQQKLAYQNNPELKIIISNKRLAFYKNNPDAWAARNEKHKQTLKDNPDIIVKQRTKTKQTLEANPSIRTEACKKRSITRRNTYKELYKKDSTIPYFLYIVKHLEKPIIKIGITMYIKKRMSELNNIFGTSEAYYIIKSSYTDIVALESYLHNHFNNHCKVQPTGGGRTEWFDNCVLEEAVSIASSY